MHRRIFLIGAILILCGFNLLVWSLNGITYAHAGKINTGVTAQGVALGGLTKQQALAKLAPVHAALQKKPLTLSIDNQTYPTTLNDLGYTINTSAIVDAAFHAGKTTNPLGQLKNAFIQGPPTAIPLQFTQDKAKLQDYLATIQNNLPAPQDISLDYENGKLSVMPPVNGITLEQDAAVAAINTAVANINNTNEPIALPANSVAPAIASTAQVNATQSFLQKLLAQPLTIQVDTFSTQLSPNDIFSMIVFAQQDGNLVTTFDQSKLKTEAAAIAKQAAIPAKAKRVSSTDNSVIDEGQDGRKIDTDQTADQLLDKLKSGDTTTPLVLTPQTIARSTVTETPEYTLGRVDGKYIDIDLSKQRLNLIDGNTWVQGFSVSTGKWSTPTPVGQFAVQNHVSVAWSKTFKLYMPFWMAITPDGQYGIHGLPYWPGGKVEDANHIGTPVSHGCIRLGPGNIQTVYAWAANGTPVFIHK